MLDVLVVDDDDIVRESIAEALVLAGHRVDQARDGENALSMIAQRAFELIVCDVRMPRLDGLTLFRRLKREAPGTSVVLMTSFGTIPDAVGTLREGAVDYVTKPFDSEEFVDTVVRPIAERRALMRRFDEARSEHIGREVGATLVQASLVMRQLAEKATVTARSEAPVILAGEAGVGKKLVAQTLHVTSPRREGPFVVVPCESLAELMVESELRELSEIRPRNGRDEWFRAAEGGTLVLDGIERLSSGAQASLVRVLDERPMQARRGREWQPLGVRVIATTREDPTALMDDGRLLDTLYFRLGSAHLRVPPLRDRRGDLYELVFQVLRDLAPPTTTPARLSPQAWAALASYAFPGNVRELRWALEHALTMARGSEIGIEELPSRITKPATASL